MCIYVEVITIHFHYTNYQVFMRKILIILLSLLISQSCSSVPKEIKQKFGICYTGKDTDIESHIDINGYYTSGGQGGMIFFKDGMYTTPIFENREINTSDTCVNLVHAITRMYKNKPHISIGYHQGMYWIEGDTIKVRSFGQTGGRFTPWSFWEEWYKIIDRQTLKIIYEKPLLDMDARFVQTVDEWQRERKRSLVRFHCADSIPSSDCWLKEEKWFWCNEQDWKNYMERIKERKKK